MSVLARISAAGRALFTTRASDSPSASDFDPFDARVNNMWGMVRGSEPVQYTAQGRTVRLEGLMKNAIVNSCVRIVADQIATVPIEAYRISVDGDVDLQPNSPLQKLLDQPMPQTPGFTFRRMIGAYVPVYGNAYGILIRRTPNGPPIGIRPLPPERLQQVLVDGATDEILFYVWSDSSGKQHTTPWTDVIHVKDLILDPDGWFGFPRGVAALIDILTDGEASHYVRQVITNYGAPGVAMLMHDGEWEQESLNAAEERYQEKMVERGGRGRARFLAGVKDIKVIGHTLKDLEFPALRQITREDICSAFGVDPRLAGASSAKGSESAMSGGQYQEARRKLEQLTCAPMRMAIVDALDTTLTPEFGYTYVRFSPEEIGKLIETPTEVATRVTLLVEKNIATLEEARRAVGLPEQLDTTHHTTATSIRTVAKAIELSELPPPTALPPAGKSAPIAGKPEQRALPTPAVIVTTRAIRGHVTLTKTQRDILWRAADVRATALESTFADRAQSLFALDSAIVTQLIEASANEGQTRAANDELQIRVRPSFYERAARAVATYYAPKGQAHDSWTRGFAPDISLTMGDAASALSADLGVSFDLTNPRVVEAISTRVNKLAGHVGQTTLRQLQEIIAAGRIAGQNADEIARAIRAGVFDPAITEARAKVIARTETMGALNEGEYLAALESGVMQSISWLDQADDHVRATHVKCAEQGWIALGERFSNGLRYPHDPEGAADEVIQCRCAALFSDLTPDEAQLEQPMGNSQ